MSVLSGQGLTRGFHSDSLTIDVGFQHFHKRPRILKCFVWSRGLQGDRDHRRALLLCPLRQVLMVGSISDCTKRSGVNHKNVRRRKQYITKAPLRCTNICLGLRFLQTARSRRSRVPRSPENSTLTNLSTHPTRYVCRHSVSTLIHVGYQKRE